jgi:hypothetical protein
MTAGPILTADELGGAILAALCELNPGLEVVARGAYVRVRGQSELRVTRAAIERHLGAPFRLPGDLERSMPSFEGRFTVDEEEARWTAPAGAQP